MKLVIVTGMSGAGKTTVLNFLEDSGYYCVDNLPAPLIMPFVHLAESSTDSEYQKVALGVDGRNGKAGDRALEEALDQIRTEKLTCQILFLEASDEILIKRYKETRRTHPISGREGSLEDGIKKERVLLKYLKERADYILDTSQLLTRDLKKEVRRVIVEENSYKNLYITVLSFGFKYGVPAEADLVMDVRFLPNPYYDLNLRMYTGLDEPIQDFLNKFSQTSEFLEKFTGLVDFLIPNYIAEGKNQLVIAVGCTGGRHRSVMMADAIYRHLTQYKEYGLRVEHRDMHRDPAHKPGQYEVQECPSQEM
ncbi:MAG: RNase adapter RapZ [Lachnospiraceae bacterium]|nr:RNase adapter RapZ [Lachnospiraceae bacterium]